MSEPNLFDSEPSAFSRESDIEEYKEAWTEDCLKELAAFANTQGGTLYVGVKDSGEIIGWDGSGKQEEAISSKIVDSLRVHPAKLAVEEKAHKQVLMVRMAAAAAPVSLRGRYYQRVGSTSREVPAEELPRFLLEKTGQTWDAQPCEYGVEELTAGTINDFRVLSGDRLPQMSPSDSPLLILSKLKLLLPNGRMKRAAFLLFGEDPQRLLTTAQVQIGRFKDEETILDDKRIDGNLFQQITQAEQALRNYLLVRYEFPSGSGERGGIESLQREEVWEFPYKAVREALMNALIHRDYTSTGRIQIRVYDDRMIISNPGGLPAGLTLSDLLKEPHDSLPRNPILAQVCYYAKLVEQWGSGTIRMRNACRDRGIPDPVFTSTPTNFTVTLRKDELSDERLRQLGMNARQIMAVHYVRQNGSIGTTEMQSLTNVPRRTAARDLDLLVEGGVLSRSVPTGRAVRYTMAKRE